VEHREEFRQADVPALALPQSRMRDAGHPSNPNRREVATSAMTVIDDIYYDLQQFIRANYASQITLDDFTRVRGIARRDAQEALSYNATSWAKLLLDQRMQVARELLSYSGESTEAIALRIGYSLSQFERTFKAEEGKEPEEYRRWKQNKEQEVTSPPNGSPSS
jgi:AraC-like DNA-binding protein